MGKLVRTQHPNPTPGYKTVDSSNPDWRITSEGSYTYVNTYVELVGSAGAGWVQGKVVSTDYDHRLQLGGDEWLADQYKLDLKVYSRFGDNNSPMAFGDSGGPVFEVTNNPSSGDVKLHGILIGWDDADQTYPVNVVVSPLGQIYFELGLSATWDSCYSGC